MRVKITEILNRFRSFLLKNSERIKILEEKDDVGESLNNWLQENWELQVEKPISALMHSDVFLPAYGEGADVVATSLRVSNPDARTTHKILVVGKEATVPDLFSGKPADLPELTFDHFVDYRGGKYGHGPKFDFVLLNSKGNGIVLVDVENVDFEIVETGEFFRG